MRSGSWRRLAVEAVESVDERADRVFGVRVLVPKQPCSWVIAVSLRKLRRLERRWRLRWTGEGMTAR